MNNRMANSYSDANGVFLNKLGITDAAELKRAEYMMTRARAAKILSKQVDLAVQGFGLARQQAIHGYFFQDVYDWAGKTRTVPSSKRMENGMVSVFANPDSFEKNGRN